MDTVGCLVEAANASDKEPAKLIAFFICDHQTPLTVPPLDGHKAK
jgi:hypothetical protein